MKTKNIYITVRLEIKEDFDGQDVTSEMDYTMDHDGIVGTEIIGVDCEED